MKLPYMSNAVQKYKQQTVTFSGINYGEGYQDGQLLDSEGLSASLYPCLTQRTGRTLQGEYEAATGLYARGALCVVDGTDLIYGGEVVGQVEAGEKQFATINTKVVIFPDKVYLDTDTKELCPLEAEFFGYGGDVTFTTNSLTVPESAYIDFVEPEEQLLEGLDGEGSVDAYASASVDAETGEITLSTKTETTFAALTAGDIIQYECGDSSYMVVLSVETLDEGVTHQLRYSLHTAVSHSYGSFEDYFVVGDAVEISGCTSYEGNNGSHIVEGVSEHTLTFGDDIFTAGTEGSIVTMERTVPDLTCICSSDNRIWGAEGTTIYASALGDPTNFYVYQGVSTDSYAVAVGTDNDFTGCIAYSSTVLFWKENCVHKILGSYPAEYEMYTYTVPGLQAGCEKSMVIINEVLFYKSRNGIYVYSGSTPDLISSCFGIKTFEGGVAGTDGVKYYISLMGEDGEWNLFVFDTLSGIFLREGDTQVADFAQLDGILYYLDAETGAVMSISDDDGEVISWSMTMCPFNEVTLGRKGYSRLYLRADLEATAWLKIEISVDGNPFRQIFISHDKNAKTVQVPIIPTRCDTFTVRISGKGGCLLKSIVREFSVGSEV